MKRRKIRPKEPTVFSIRLKPDNLEKLKEIQDNLMLDNRNMTLNFIIDNYYLYEINKDFIQALRKIIKRVGFE